MRLINNCIKHNDSKVSDDLSRKFPGEYTKNDEIDINPELVYELLEITVNQFENLINCLINIIMIDVLLAPVKLMFFF